MTFERGATAGNFFREYPRQRKLISINKRFRGKVMRDPLRPLTEEFAMRHDWNSLLGDGTSPMTERTRDLYPHADELYVHARTQPRSFAPARRVTGGVLSRQHGSTAARQHGSTAARAEPTPVQDRS